MSLARFGPNLVSLMGPRSSGVGPIVLRNQKFRTKGRHEGMQSRDERTARGCGLGSTVMVRFSGNPRGVFQTGDRMR